MLLDLFFHELIGRLNHSLDLFSTSLLILPNSQLVFDLLDFLIFRKLKLCLALTLLNTLVNEVKQPLTFGKFAISSLEALSNNLMN